MTHTCPICRVSYTGPRNKKTCSDRCRKQKSRLGLASWDDVKSELVKMGLDATKDRIVTDDAFRDQLIGHLERQEEIHPPTGPVVIPGDIDSEALALAASDGYHVSDVYGYRLPSDADIDAAEASGDWGPMLNTAAAMLTANRDYIAWAGRWPSGEAGEQLIDERRRLTADQHASGHKWLDSLSEQVEPLEDISDAAAEAA